jgi:hypothetical protein
MLEQARHGRKYSLEKASLEHLSARILLVFPKDRIQGFW